MDYFTSSLSLSSIKLKAPSLSLIQLYDSNVCEYEQWSLFVKDHLFDFNREGRG